MTNPAIERLLPIDPMDEWNDYVTHSPQGSLFCTSWWLDAVCPGDYEILLYRNENRIAAGMPIFITRTLGIHAIRMPPLTPVLGVIFPPPKGDNYERNLSSEMESLKCLIQGIPKVELFNVHFHPGFTNWLPFYWSGYRQTTLYTYALEDLTDLPKVFAGFAHAKRKNIKKAESLVTVHTDLDPLTFYLNHQMTLRKQGSRISYGWEMFRRIHEATYNRGAGKTWYALDKEGQLHAAIFVVFDETSAYFLISTSDPDFRNTGAITLLVKNAIEFLSHKVKRFDFEGSMIEGVEGSFRKFGARQVPYFAIRRSSNLVQLLTGCRSALSLFRRKLGTF